MREGSLEAPTRHPIAWQDPGLLRPGRRSRRKCERVFDICHGCRRCFNLCDSFPRLFDLIDESPTGELDSVDSDDFKPVVDACTLCDMCFMTKCPYVPPHEFNLDFPHLMLRYRAMEAKRRARSRSPTGSWPQTDRNGKLAGMVAPLANWATDAATTPTAADAARARRHRIRDAELPKYASRQLRCSRAAATPGGATATRRPSAARRCSTRPASSTTTTPTSASPRARCWPGTASRPRSSIRAAAACRCWSRAASPTSPTAPADRRRGDEATGSTRATTSSRWCRPAR